VSFNSHLFPTGHSSEFYKMNYCLLKQGIINHHVHFVVTEYSSIRSDTLVHTGKERQGKETRRCEDQTFIQLWKEPTGCISRTQASSSSYTATWAWKFKGL